MSARNLEVEDLTQFQALLAAGESSLSGWHLQSLDLRGVDFSGLSVESAVFLGCLFDAGVEASLRARGALLFPVLPGVPFDSYRAKLYTGGELYQGIGDGYEATTDGRIYQWTLTAPRNLDGTLATAMHDHSIGDALDDFLNGELASRGVVGVMGGHAISRGSGAYAQAAELAAGIARAGYLLATGGGPGAMEAANLGAWLSRRSTAELDWALAKLAEVPDFKPSVSDWVLVAQQVLDRFPDGVQNLGIPTWFYGHEPPNVFASQIAKYFANAVREAVLLERCTGGIVFLPGAAGTVQEIFQDGCENYYASAASAASSAPMVLLGRQYWTEQLPVWPLLNTLAEGRAMAAKILLADSVAEAVQFLS
ncbi:LOG family protein [Psychromicrobium lacuslunae]|uniref:Rossmann fold nucleotide-binding protein n=1 Tax=Psychromicrobium lacuslunae TaxID=1618207 RepID=A0A0D4C2S4_9MICC|nr:Rossmann fold nucleotide-binding protein [Psychromicrobium lacuslunae]AJT42685.1 Rossmann fold nucleotide-binding protein [Psychromicrobium lacuslunae]